MLGEHCNDAEVLVSALKVMWTHQLRSKDEEALFQSIRELTSNSRSIFENPCFSLLGHSYAAVASDRALSPVEGSDLNSYFWNWL